MKFYEALKAATPKLEAEFNMSQIIQHSPSKGALREYILNSVIRPFLPILDGTAVRRRKEQDLSFAIDLGKVMIEISRLF